MRCLRGPWVSEETVASVSKQNKRSAHNSRVRIMSLWLQTCCFARKKNKQTNQKKRNKGNKKISKITLAKRFVMWRSDLTLTVITDRVRTNQTMRVYPRINLLLNNTNIGPGGVKYQDLDET